MPGDIQSGRGSAKRRYRLRISIRRGQQEADSRTFRRRRRLQVTQIAAPPKPRGLNLGVLTAESRSPFELRTTFQPRSSKRTNCLNFATAHSAATRPGLDVTGTGGYCEICDKYALHQHHSGLWVRPSTRSRVSSNLETVDDMERNQWFCALSEEPWAEVLLMVTGAIDSKPS